jgi:hypothetical protein
MLPPIYTATQIRRYNASHVHTALFSLNPARLHARKVYDTSLKSNTYSRGGIYEETRVTSHQLSDLTIEDLLLLPTVGLVASLLSSPTADIGGTACSKGHNGTSLPSTKVPHGIPPTACQLQTIPPPGLRRILSLLPATSRLPNTRKKRSISPAVQRQNRDAGRLSHITTHSFRRSPVGPPSDKFFPYRTRRPARAVRSGGPHASETRWRATTV